MPTQADGSGHVQRATLLVLGASGDLTERLLLPGLGELLAHDDSIRLTLVGAGRTELGTGRWRERVAHAFATSGASGRQLDTMVAQTRYISADVTAEPGLAQILSVCTPPLVIVFALPPAATLLACQLLGLIGVAAGTRLVLEKPFGSDATSARRLNTILTRLVSEQRIHRVDHFLGDSTVLNILGLRFANRILEPVLNRDHVESVEITFAETLGLEGRAGYYDHAGALVDMIQSHLLQILALLTMDAPATMHPEDFRASTARALRATHLWADDPVHFSRRGRYCPGRIDHRELPAYVDEPGVDPARDTETFAELTVAVDTPPWAGVPFRLCSGKALARPRGEAVITFKHPPHTPEGLTGYTRPDRLRIGFGPDGLALDLNINGRRGPSSIDPVTLRAEFSPGGLSAYAEVLRAVLAGDLTLSVRADTAERCWQIIEPVQTAWRQQLVPMLEYPAGSDGPPPAA